MGHSQILTPVVALVAWTLVMQGWMYITRFPAMRAAGIDLSKLVGSRGADADKILPAQVQWKAHNYNHLLEQPTLFYAIALTLAILGLGDGVSAGIAWIYVAVRVAHSLVQATVNRVAIRFLLFTLATLALLMLVLGAAVALVQG